MSERTREEEIEWAAAMVELEEERGSIVPGGAQGGVVARARRVTRPAEPRPGPSAAARSRERVRHWFQANDFKAA